jgi:hypothetical protein
MGTVNTPTPAPLTEAQGTSQALSPDKSTNTASPVVSAPAKSSTLINILKSAGAVVAGGGFTFLAGLQQGTSLKQSAYAAGAAALATLVGFITKSPRQ